MSHKNTYILAILMAIVSFTSCTDNDFMGAPLTEEGTEVYVSVTLNVGGNTQGTRAGSPQMDYGSADVDYGSAGVDYGSVGTRAGVSAPNDGAPSLDMKEGLAYENYIKPYNVDLYIFDNDLKFVAKSISIIPTSNRCIGIFDKIATEHITASQTTPYHIVAVCNHLQEVELTAGTSTLDDLIEKLTYSYNSSFTANLVAEKYTSATIPMWGILPFKFEEPTATDNMTTLTDPINVLRAMAKVRIRLTASDYTLNSVTLNVANEKGFVAAQKNGETPQAYVKNTANTGYTTAWNTDESVNPANATPILYPSIPSGVSTINSGLTFSQVTEEEVSGYHVIYIPEYKNIATSEDETVTPASMTLNISKGSETKNYTLHFADYSATTAPSAPEWDIIRNDIYDYTITGITEPGGLQANVRVMPWEYEKMEYELSQDQAVQVTWASFSPYKYDDYGNYALPVAHESELNQGFVRVNVKLNQPVGVKWMARLTNTRDFKFVYEYTPPEGEGDKETYADYGFGGEGEVTIAIAPVNPYEANTNKRTELYFTIETLTDGYAQIEDPSGYVTSATYHNNTLNTIPDRICIVQTVKDNIQFTWSEE